MEDWEHSEYSEDLVYSEYLEYLEDLEHSEYSEYYEYSEYLEHLEDWEHIANHDSCMTQKPCTRQLAQCRVNSDGLFLLIKCRWHGVFSNESN